jgi:hypothetical protein
MPDFRAGPDSGFQSSMLLGELANGQIDSLKSFNPKSNVWGPPDWARVLDRSLRLRRVSTRGPICVQSFFHGQARVILQSTVSSRAVPRGPEDYSVNWFKETKRFRSE